MTSVYKIRIRIAKKGTDDLLEYPSQEWTPERLQTMLDYIKKWVNMVELNWIDQCKYYEWDRDACEEYCRCSSAKEKLFPKTDFDAKKVCPECPYREVKEDGQK
jgi:hypothetical protein